MLLDVPFYARASAIKDGQVVARDSAPGRWMAPRVTRRKALSTPPSATRSGSNGNPELALGGLLAGLHP